METINPFDRCVLALIKEINMGATKPRNMILQDVAPKNVTNVSKNLGGKQCGNRSSSKWN
jgi:hypothetical protein